MAGLGFDSEALYRKHFDDVEFCSNRLYETSNGLVFGPKPGRVLAKLGYIVNPPENVTRESMMRGVALGLRTSCSFIPPLRTVIDRVLELTEGHEAFYQRGFDEHVMKMRGTYSPSVETHLHMSDQYCWDFGKQDSFSDLVSRLQLGEAYDCSYADMLFDRDTSGPQRIFGGWGVNSLPIAA